MGPSWVHHGSLMTACKETPRRKQMMYIPTIGHQWGTHIIIVLAHESPMDHPFTSNVRPWVAHGVGVMAHESPKGLRRVTHACFLLVHGSSMGLPWITLGLGTLAHGSPIHLRWVVHGFSASPWVPLRPATGLPWAAHGSAIGLL